jgi:hypothetical protein
VSGEIKAYVGGSFVWKPVKVWNGSAWVTKPLKFWNGSAWTLTNNGGSSFYFTQPTLTLTSADGAAPIWKVTSSDAYGAFIEQQVLYGVEGASDAQMNAGAAGIGSGGVTDFKTFYTPMQGADWELGTSTTENYVTPTGAWTSRVRITSDPWDLDTAVYSDWSNKTQDTVTVPVGMFAHIALTDWKYDQLTLSNNYRTLQGAAQGQMMSARSTRTGADKGQFEVKMDTIVASSRVVFGFENGTTDFSVYDARPGVSNSAGVTVEIFVDGTTINVFWNGTAGYLPITAPSANQANDVFSIIPNRTTNVMKLYRTRGGTSVLLGSPTVPNLSTFTRAWAGVKNDDKITGNWGNATYAHALDSGDVPYG